jgi:hypothetical protein
MPGKFQLVFAGMEEPTIMKPFLSENYPFIRKDLDRIRHI